MAQNNGMAMTAPTSFAGSYQTSGVYSNYQQDPNIYQMNAQRMSGMQSPGTQQATVQQGVSLQPGQQQSITYQQGTPVQQIQQMVQGQRSGFVNPLITGFVQGEAGAQAFYVPAGTAAVLFDNEQDRFYFKAVDYNGIPYPLVCYEYFKPVKEQPPQTVQPQPQEPVIQQKQPQPEMVQKNEPSAYLTKDEAANMISSEIDRVIAVINEQRELTQDNNHINENNNNNQKNKSGKKEK